MAVGSTSEFQEQAALVISNDGRTPLHLVTDVSKAEEMIRSGTDFQEVDDFGMSSLHLAAARKNVDVCRLLLKFEPKLACALDHAGNTPLYWATLSIDIVRLLIKHDSPIEHQNNFGETAAMRACLQGQYDVVALLLLSSSNIDSQDKSGKTMLMMASQQGFFDISKLLLMKGAGPNLCDLTGWTALHFAAHGGWPQHESHPKLMRLLLDHGANPSLTEFSCNWQPLHVCTDASAVAVLHEYGVNVNATDSSGRTAAHHLNAEAVAELHRYGAQLDLADDYGRTPLHYVASVEKAITLVSFGCNINALDGKFNTPLDWAQNRPLVADALMALGAKSGSDCHQRHNCIIC